MDQDLQELLFVIGYRIADWLLKNDKKIIKIILEMKEKGKGNKKKVNKNVNGGIKRRGGGKNPRDIQNRLRSKKL